jgi:hypothetical protein
MKMISSTKQRSSIGVTFSSLITWSRLGLEKERAMRAYCASSQPGKAAGGSEATGAGAEGAPAAAGAAARRRRSRSCAASKIAASLAFELKLDAVGQRAREVLELGRHDLHLREQVVVTEGGGDRDEQAEGRRDEGAADAGSELRDAGLLGQRAEGDHHAPHGAEQAEERTAGNERTEEHHLVLILHHRAGDAALDRVLDVAHAQRDVGLADETALVALHRGDGFGDEEFVRPEIRTAREVEGDDGRLVAQAAFERMIATTEFLDVGPFADHRAPADEGTDEQDARDGHAGGVHLLEVPERALRRVSQHDHEDRRKHRFHRQSALGMAST